MIKKCRLVASSSLRMIHTILGLNCNDSGKAAAISLERRRHPLPIHHASQTNWLDVSHAPLPLP